MEHQPQVTWNDARNRYDLHVAGELAGFADVTIDGDVATFTHTEVSDDFQGHGLARVLVDDALADTVARHLRIIPRCPYVSRHLRRHDIPGATVEWPKS